MVTVLKNIYYYFLNLPNNIKSNYAKKKRKKYKYQHQLTSTTGDNRYPEIFSAIQQLVDNNNDQLKLLSYGCSTGEECFSLRKYFPNANIVGADINIDNLNKANSINKDNFIHFVESTSENLKAKSSYDVIFAMSVLCRWEDTKDVKNCENIYPFYRFDDTIKNLVSLLKENGLLIVYNANFKVEDSSASTLLLPLKIDGIKESGCVHKFDSNNNRDEKSHSTIIYKKLNP
jgi:predicted O-methyltransferase YrrM